MLKKLYYVLVISMLITAGLTLFGVVNAEAKSKNITKEQAMYLIKKADENKAKKKKTFNNKVYKDVKTSNTKVKWAYERGFINKTKSGKYKPKSEITKGQVVTALVRGWNIKASVKKKGTAKDANTKELKIVDSWGTMKKDKKGKLNPKQKLTENQFWSLVDQVYNARNKHEYETTPREIDWSEIQPGEKFPTYAKALNYQQFKTEVLKIGKTNKYKEQVKVLYVRDSTYKTRFRDEQFSMKLFNETGTNPYQLWARSMDTFVHKRNGVYRIVVKYFPENDKKSFDKIDNAFIKMKNQIIKQYNPQTDYDTVVAVNKYLNDLLTYDEENTYLDDWFGYELGGVTSCDEYAKMGRYLLQLFGLESKFLAGDMHAWVGVKIGGNWYHTDPTFYATSGAQEKFLVMTDAERFSGSVTYYYDDFVKIKTPTKAFNPLNALPLKK